MFAMYASASNHHGGGRHAVWLKATKDDQAKMVRAAPDRFFVPPYVGPSGWVGVWLDGDVDWGATWREFVREAYLLVAPKKLAAALAESPERDG